MANGNLIAERSISLASDTRECARLDALVRGFLRDHAREKPELIHDLRLVIEEILVNIIHHGYGDAIDGRIEVTISLKENSLSLSFSDIAPPFDPLIRRYNRDSDHSDGGMGIHLVRSLTDAQQYRRDHGRNVFTVTKDL